MTFTYIKMKILWIHNSILWLWIQCFNLLLSKTDYNVRTSQVLWRTEKILKCLIRSYNIFVCTTLSVTVVFRRSSVITLYAVQQLTHQYSTRVGLRIIYETSRRRSPHIIITNEYSYILLFIFIIPILKPAYSLKWV